MMGKLSVCTQQRGEIHNHFLGNGNSQQAQSLEKRGKVLEGVPRAKRGLNDDEGALCKLTA